MLYEKIYDIGNPGPGQNVAGLNWLMGSNTPFLIPGTQTAIHI
jgi:hypothetical protein